LTRENRHVDTANHLYRRCSHRSGFADLAFEPRAERIVGDGTIVIAALAAPAMSQAHVAGGIAYEETLRPEGLPDDMQPLPGVGLRLLSISAIDGFRIAAALWQPLAKPAATTLLVQLHGSGGNFASLQLRATARAVSARGFAALSISTRQHDEHVNTDNFSRSGATSRPQSGPPRRSAGALILQGHSLGTAQVAFYTATDWDPAIRGVILTGAIAKLPWKSRNILIQDEDAYRALAQAARDAVRAGRPEATLPMPMGRIGGRQAPVTARHFLTYRDEAASAADTTFWVARIPRPILLVRDAANGVVLPFVSLCGRLPRRPHFTLPQQKFGFVPVQLRPKRAGGAAAVISAGCGRQPVHASRALREV
jgi:pimeloyl-ACP methyl ester carboxylesterase